MRRVLVVLVVYGSLVAVQPSWAVEPGFRLQVAPAVIYKVDDQQTRTPDVDAQRAAMKKLSFLVGKWSGEARTFRVPGQPVELTQTEEVEYKLDGLILIIEGVGRTKSDGRVVLQALGIL
jgi:hypothetical protein